MAPTGRQSPGDRLSVKSHGGQMIKSTFLSTMILFSAQMAFANSIQCRFFDVSNEDNQIQVHLLLASGPYNIEYIDDEGLDVGGMNYSFDLIIDKFEDSILINAIFYENMKVQDEIVSYSWEFDDGEDIHFEELIEDNAHQMVFSCSLF
jgi:hypothetical protein